MIATDHAPHAPWEKADFEKAPNGALGLETSLAAGITALVRPGHISLLRLLELMSTDVYKRQGPGGPGCGSAGYAGYGADDPWYTRPAGAQAV